jgi:hypothetical protein
VKRILFALLVIAAPAQARDSLGVFEGWGAFRDAQPLRCYAIAEPARSSGGKWRPFASIAHWPGEGVRGQIHIHLSREVRGGAKVVLSIDDRRITLVGGGADAWAANPRADASIIAAIRSGRSMSIASVAATGGGFADTYRLKGAATAIDSAALGCARANSG